MHVFAGLWLLYYIQITRCEFQQHIDLQKITEIKFRNEKYNVLKPTIHVVRDHFADVIQKRRNDEFPTNRLFMDKNGFRHFWKGMEVQTNLRKNIRKDLSIVANVTKGATVNKKQPKRKKKVFEKLFVPNIDPSLLRKGEGSLVKTTFFCPFFGVMTMLTDVNLDGEAANVAENQ